MDSVHEIGMQARLTDDCDPDPPPPRTGGGARAHVCVASDVARDAEHLIAAAVRLARFGDLAAAEWCGHLLPVACLLLPRGEVRPDAIVGALLADLEASGRQDAAAAVQRAAQREARTGGPGMLDRALAALLLRVDGVSHEDVAELVGASRRWVDGIESVRRAA